MRLLHGRPLAERLNARSRERSDALRARDIHPALAAISVGIDPAANTYLQRLVRGGKALGIAVHDISLSRDATEPTLFAELDRASRDPKIHGVLLLTPLPGKLDEGHVVDHIAPDKDVEGLNPYNVGLLLDGRPQVRALDRRSDRRASQVPRDPVTGGSDVVVVGRSTVVGRPAAALLLNEDATVTVAHKRTADVARADASRRGRHRRGRPGRFPYRRHDLAGRDRHRCGDQRDTRGRRRRRGCRQRRERRGSAQPRARWRRDRDDRAATPECADRRGGADRRRLAASGRRTADGIEARDRLRRDRAEARERGTRFASLLHPQTH